jgi:hypothetical protein
MKLNSEFLSFLPLPFVLLPLVIDYVEGLRNFSLVKTYPMSSPRHFLFSDNQSNLYFSRKGLCRWSKAGENFNSINSSEIFSLTFYEEKNKLYLVNPGFVKTYLLPNLKRVDVWKLKPSIISFVVRSENEFFALQKGSGTVLSLQVRYSQLESRDMRRTNFHDLCIHSGNDHLLLVKSAFPDDQAEVLILRLQDDKVIRKFGKQHLRLPCKTEIFFGGDIYVSERKNLCIFTWSGEILQTVKLKSSTFHTSPMTILRENNDKVTLVVWRCSTLWFFSVT